MGQSNTNQNSPQSVPIPHHEESEKALLGAVLIDSSIFPEMVKLVKAEDFFMLRHGWIYEAFVALYERGEEIDVMTVSTELKQRLKDRYLDHIGGDSYLTELTNSVPRVGNWPTYAAVVVELSRERQALELLGNGAEAVLKGDGDKFAVSVKQLMALLEDRTAGVLRLLAQLMPAEDLINLPPLRWLIKGQILERGLTLMYGAPGAGKSFLALDYALQVSQSLPVVYVASEGIHGYGQRIAAWKLHNHLSEAGLWFLPMPVPLLNPQAESELSSLVREHKAKLVVIDTLADSVLPGDENSTHDMGLFLKACRRIIEQNDCGILLVHHTNKTGMDRGSSTIRAASDVVIKVTNDDDVMVVECDKTRDAERFKTGYLKMLPVQISADVQSRVLIPTSQVVSSPGDPVSRTQEKVLAALSDSPNGASMQNLESATGLGNGTVWKALNRLMKAGYVKQEYARDPYQITPAGVQKLAGAK